MIVITICAFIALLMWLTAFVMQAAADADVTAPGMSAFGQDPQGLEAKPASPTAKPGRSANRIR